MNNFKIDVDFLANRNVRQSRVAKDEMALYVAIDENMF